MRGQPKRPRADESGGTGEAAAEAILQIKVWLKGISPMIWRRVLVPASFTLRELHGVIQVAMGWDGIHLYQFRLRAARYGSWELTASSPDVTLAALRFRKGARFGYEYDLNIPWQHEVRLENRLDPEAGKTYPLCAAGGGASPPEDCGGPGPFMECRDDILSLDSREDLATMADIIGDVVLERRLEILDDDETRWRLEQAVARSRARERAQGNPFSRRAVNARLGHGAHRDLMYQQCW
jgi:hypothetical protein